MVINIGKVKEHDYDYIENEIKRVVAASVGKTTKVISETCYLTDEEKDGNFKLRYVPLDIVEDVLKENIESCGDAQGIAEEMLEVLKIYFQNV